MAELTRELNAPFDAALVGRIDEAWEFVKESVLDGAKRAADDVGGSVDAVWAKVSELIRTAGTKARLVEEGLLERMRVYAAGLQKSMLAQVMGELSVGGTMLSLTSIELTQSVRVEGSLKASLTELVHVSKNGSLELSASYQRLK